MPYLRYFSQFNPYPMYPPQQYLHSSLTTMGIQNPIEGVTGEQTPPLPPVTLIILIQETGTCGKGEAKMMDYLKLNIPKYKEGDDPSEYVKAVN